MASPVRIGSVRVRFVPKASSARSIMNSSGVQSVLSEKVDAVVAAADSMGSASYAGNVQPGRTRAHGIVYTPSHHAIASNARHNSLLRALGAARG